MRPSVVFLKFLETNAGADPQLGQHCLLLNQLSVHSAIRRCVVWHTNRAVKGNSTFEYRPVDWPFLEVIFLSLSRKILGMCLKTIAALRYYEIHHSKPLNFAVDKYLLNRPMIEVGMGCGRPLPHLSRFTQAPQYCCTLRLTILAYLATSGQDAALDKTPGPSWIGKTFVWGGVALKQRSK